jgi:hypothetical protein
MSDISEIIEKAKQRLAAMTPAERTEMYQAQRESWARSMTPCEHGVRDWEDCPDCRAAALGGRHE